MTNKLYPSLRIALCIPCFNEASSITKVIRDFQKVIPELSVYVFDNNSTDNTAELARAAGANVVRVHLKGKGNVVRRMFADIDADIYLMVDGDATYDAGNAVLLVSKLLQNNCDMVVACRQVTKSSANSAYRPGHQWGNRWLTRAVVAIFGGSFTDMLSGYRAFSRRYAKSFPSISHDFEIETELTIHALELRMSCAEITTPYYARAMGSESKLSTYRDGWKILKTIFRLCISEKPLLFFGAGAVLMATISIILAIPLLNEYWYTGLVPRFPTAFLSASIMVVSLLSLACGLIIEQITCARHEIKHLAYLAIPATHL